MSVITCNEDLRQLARRRVPRAIFDYVDRGSYDEATLRANRADLDAIKLRQRVMIDVDNRLLGIHLVGRDWTIPGAPDPTGMDVSFTPRKMFICSIETVR